MSHSAGRRVAGRARPLWTGALLCAALLPGARADVYRVVMPDGRVTYTDQPPADPRARTTVVDRPAVQGALVVPPPLTRLVEPAGLPAPRPPASAPPSPVPPATRAALVDILGRLEMLGVLQRLCVPAEPTLAGAVQSAVEGWHQRNAAATTLATQRLQSEFDLPQRAQVRADAHARLLPVLTPLQAAVPAARAMWCEDAVAALDHRRFDLVGPQGPMDALSASTAARVR